MFNKITIDPDTLSNKQAAAVFGLFWAGLGVIGCAAWVILHAIVAISR
jgi:hypothetical protein